MNPYKITYEDALEICDAHNNFNFYKKDFIIDGYKVVIFNYFLCDYNMFAKPLKNKPEINAFDMRGLTFVFNYDGTLYNRYLMLPKFFNINETESTQYSLIKDKKIKTITVKDDGSLIGFMSLPNGNVFSKTLGSTTNDQSNAAMKIYEEDLSIQDTVNSILINDCTPLFEYVSPDNKIVRNYSVEDIKFIGFRDNITGKYISVGNFDETIIKTSHVEIVHHQQLDELIEICKTTENIEGYVIEFEDDQLIKLKSGWYFDVHKLHTESINREDYVIELYLNNKLDDIMSQFDINTNKNIFNFVDEIKLAINNYSYEIYKGIIKLQTIYTDIYDNDIQKFSRNEHKDPYFNFTKTLVEDGNGIRCNELVKQYILKKSYRLQNARKIVEQYKNK